MVAVQGTSHICCLPLERLKLSEEDFWIRKNSYQISIKMQEGKLLQEKLRAECKALQKKAKETSEIASMEREKLS